MCVQKCCVRCYLLLLIRRLLLSLCHRHPHYSLPNAAPQFRESPSLCHSAKASSNPSERNAQAKHNSATTTTTASSTFPDTNTATYPVPGQDPIQFRQHPSHLRNSSTSSQTHVQTTSYHSG
ncbi:hypothetical protein BDZ91DRAFT_533620 [Kalaharituber pfeilii]|nr:hypothetical protein BDZ91DRAFT_533620 [Kalaharituber pfeilii]